MYKRACSIMAEARACLLFVDLVAEPWDSWSLWSLPRTPRGASPHDNNWLMKTAIQVTPKKE
jgi:hypothetical protein